MGGVSTWVLWESRSEKPFVYTTCSAPNCTFPTQETGSSLKSLSTGHPNNPNLVPNLRNLTRGECAFACAEEVFEGVEGVRVGREFGSEDGVWN